MSMFFFIKKKKKVVAYAAAFFLLLSCNLILKIIYEDGGCLNLGTIDLPVRLEYTNEQVLMISSKYKQRA